MCQADGRECKMSRQMKQLCTILFLCALLFCCGGCGSDGGARIKSYRIYRVEGTDPLEMTQFLTDMARQQAGARLKNTADEGADWISLLSEEGSANEYGYTVEGMEPKGFTIARDGNHLFLLARTDEGLKRACRYLFDSLVDGQGRLLLADGQVYADTGRDMKDAIYIGDAPIGEYTILYGDKGAKAACEELRDYIYRTDGELLAVADSKSREGAGILLSVDGALPAGTGRTVIENGEVSIAGADPDALKREMYLFVNTWLGWMDAGEPEAHISSVGKTVYVPDEVRAVTDSWMEEREAIVTLWNVDFTRGVYKNEATSLKNNILDYTEEQIYEYVKMLKYCGFTGVQATDMCSAWAGTDGYEATHEKIRMMADAAHSLGMKFTLWVWGAHFNGFSWVDDEVSYAAGESGFAYDNPDTVATFEKYYSIYAELADCCDRVIAHFYDPGMLSTSEDVAYFAKMLRSKFLAVNPEIDFGVSCWVDAFEKGAFVRAMGTDITLYEGVFYEDESQYVDFRQSVAGLETRLGTWAWDICEMEIDQLAQMNFNMDIIRKTYQTARKYDEICKPTYWSEMDSYHVLNAFSLYCAGQMLIDPDMDGEELYARLSRAVVGEEYADAFAEMLRLIQDARSGSDWSQYWWPEDSYLLKSDAYPAESILQRCEAYIPVLRELIEKKIESRTFPFPIALEEVFRMMLPHLEQIQEYARFRMELEKLEEEWRQGAQAEALSVKLKEIAEPIPCYNSVIGIWGQIEARAQREMVLAFCERTGAEIPIYPEWDRQRKQYIYAQMVTDQKGIQEPVRAASPYYQYGLAFGEETERLVREMVEEGLLVQEPDGAVYLTDWENYRHHFD